MKRPSVFVGSSTEGLDVARAVQTQLEDDCEIKLWSEGVFGLSFGTLESLVNSLEQFDFAILALTGDDLVLSRGEITQAPRDNVMFELGLFMGHLGRPRTFIVCSRETVLPADLAGVAVAQFNPPTREANLVSALGPACNRIRAAMRSIGILEREELPRATGRIEPSDDNLVDHVQILHGSAELQQNDKLYVAVMPVALARFFPDCKVGGFRPIHDRWTAQVQIGLPWESGCQFYLHLLAAGTDAQQVLEIYAEYGNKTDTWLGLKDLPKGIRIIDTIEVTRR